MRIFQILEKNRFNTGSVHQMFQAASALRERGHEVWVVSRPGEELERRAREAGLGFAGFPFRNELDLKTIRGVAHLVGEQGPDVIHVHKGLSHTLALVATWRDRVPAFVVNRGVSFPLRPWNRLKYTTRRVDRVVTVCEDIRQVIIRSGRVDPAKVVVIYAGVDLDVFDPRRWSGEEFRVEKGIDTDRFLFMQVGVREWKGWRELVDAFSDLASEYPAAALALVACKDPQQEREVRDYATTAGVGDRVHPVEYRSDMARVLSAADCVIDASWAGTGITGTIREAMALGKPVIATDCGGNRELLSTPDVGWLVPAKERSRLAGAMREIAGDRERREAVGRGAMAHVRAGFSKEHRIDSLERLYREIVESSPAGVRRE
ncbi:MAG: glycosyltransferase family 4 protein [Thermoanaerobaculia bacterium]